MASFFEMFQLLESFEVIQEAGSTQLDSIVDNKLVAEAPPELKAHIRKIVQKGWRGGTHSVDELDDGSGNPDHIVQALLYLQEKGAVKFTDDDHFQVADMNQFVGAGGSALKGAKVGAISRKMVQAGSDAQKTRGSWQDKVKQIYGAYPEYREEFNALFKNPAWKNMTAGHKVRAEEFMQNVPDPKKFFAALTILRHEEIIGFGGEKAHADSMLTARQFKDAVHGDIDELTKKFPQYAALFQKIMSSGGWRRMMAGSPVQAVSLLGVGKSGGDFNPDVEKMLMALSALRSEGLIAFEGKPTLATIVTKANAEAQTQYQGPSKATDADRATADADARLWHANKGHGGTAQEKEAPGAMASAASMHADDPTQAISREWWNAWQKATTAIDRDPTLDNDKFWRQLHDNTLKVLQNISNQIMQAIKMGKDQNTVRPMLTNLFMVAQPRNSHYQPADIFHDVPELVRRTKAMYDGAYRNKAKVQM